MHKRIIKFEKSKTNKNAEDKKIFDYLYTAIYSKIRVINNNANQNVVVNLSQYLSVLKDDVENLAKIDNQVATNKNNLEYEKSFDEKIESAKKITETEILPGIDKISDEIDMQIYNLLGETAEQQTGKKASMQTQQLLKGLDFDAVKFKKIGLKFAFSNQSRQSEFDAELENFNDEFDFKLMGIGQYLKRLKLK